MSWAFIEETLLLLRVTRIFVELVMSCLRPASTSTIWNGSVVVSFQPSRGVRQGCPLSPYLFVMCMERLTGLIDDRVASGLWKPLRPARQGLGLSLLFYVDDLIVMGEASLAQAKIVIEYLQIFSSASGEVINPAKSRILFSHNVDGSARRAISEFRGIPMTTDLGKYLGVPLVHR